MALADAIKLLLRGFSVEITPRDSKSVHAAARTLPHGTEAFIASLPNGHLDEVVEAAVHLRSHGLVPVPHLAARNLAGETQLDGFLRRLSDEAEVERALVIGGDRDKPLGAYDDSLQILKSGLLQKHGVRIVYLACYPEGHPRIIDDRLGRARTEKLAAAKDAGFAATLVSQFCFESAPMLRMARELRETGIHNPLRIGLAGPTSAAVLLRYALICGVGNSIKALRERQSLAKNVMAGNTEGLLAELARAQITDPSFRIGGVHFFTFGSLLRTAEMIARLIERTSAGALVNEPATAT
jgi:methylenetetrahydrofolate reductase (NADPH)